MRKKKELFITTEIRITNHQKVDGDENDDGNDDDRDNYIPKSMQVLTLIFIL